jgi:hypothetical protein
MKIKMTCDVEPKIKVNNLKGQYPDWDFYFLPNEEGFLEKIVIEAKVPDYTKYKIWAGPTPDDPEHKMLHIDMDHEFNNILIEDFQYFEGMLSLLGTDVRVSWQSPFIELIPESPEEEPHKIAGFRMEKKREEPTYEIDNNDIGNILLRVKLHPPIVNPYLSFYRESLKEYNAFRFINSFFNSYYVLEGAYGNDRWRNWEVREEFKQSDEFKKITREVINDYIKKNSLVESRIIKALNNLNDPRGNPVNAKLDVDGIAYLLVDTRGSLHHFSSDPSKQHGTPFNHEEFQELASVALRIARGTIWVLLDEIDDYEKKLNEEEENKK